MKFNPAISYIQKADVWFLFINWFCYQLIRFSIKWFKIILLATLHHKNIFDLIGGFLFNLIFIIWYCFSHALRNVRPTFSISCWAKFLRKMIVHAHCHYDEKSIHCQWIIQDMILAAGGKIFGLIKPLIFPLRNNRTKFWFQIIKVI